MRELIDGSAGLLAGFDNLHVHDPAERDQLRAQIEAAARLARGA